MHPAGASQHIDQISGKGGTLTGEIPATGASASATFVQGSVTQGTAISDIVVCIAIKTSSSSDVGCSLRPTGAGSVDDLLASGEMNFTIPSESFPGGTLSVRVTLTAYGTYDAGPFSLLLAPGPEAGARANAQVIRDARVTGNIGSSTLGAGVLHPHTPGKLFRTAQATVVYHPEGLALEATTSRASVSSIGVEGNAPSEEPSISDDGRYVAFASSASTLVEDDANGVRDVFVHDRILGLTRRVSVPSLSKLISEIGPGALIPAKIPEANGASAVESGPAISGDGRYVAFSSAASNLVAEDTNGLTDVFIHDLLTLDTVRVSTRGNGDQAVGGTSVQPSLSNDGRYVAFSSSAINLVPGDTNDKADVFVMDRNSGVIEMVSFSTVGTEKSNGDSTEPAISGDGRTVVFTSLATNLVPVDTNGVSDVFIHELPSGSRTRISAGPWAGPRGGANGPSREPAISGDGQFVAFSSVATDIAPGDLNGNEDIFVYDINRPISLAFTTVGQVCAGDSIQPTLSEGHGPNGFAVIAFASSSSDLVLDDGNERWDIFVRRLSPSSLHGRASLSSFGLEGTENAVRPAVSSDGRFVAFESRASDLTILDTNGHPDILVRDDGLFEKPTQGPPNVLQAKLIAPDGAAFDEFGSSVDVEGATAVVGAPRNDDQGSRSGAAYVFTRTGCAWSQQAKLIAPDGAPGDEFGASVAIEGNTVVVGAPLDDDPVLGADAGSAHVFSRFGDTWFPEAKLEGNGPRVFGQPEAFGSSVAISDEYIAVGTNRANYGAVYLFIGQGGSWQQEVRFGDPSNGFEHMGFGASVALDGDNLVIGAPLDDFFGMDAGRVYGSRHTDGWSAPASLGTPADVGLNDHFGASLALDGEWAVAGAPLAGVNDVGDADVFRDLGQDHSEFSSPDEAFLDRGAGDLFGSSVAVGGDVALIAAPYDDGPASDSGSVYAFVFPRVRTGSMRWGLRVTLTAPGAAEDDYFGRSLALENATAIIGAPGDNGTAQNSGSVYVFVAR